MMIKFLIMKHLLFFISIILTTSLLSSCGLSPVALIEKHNEKEAEKTNELLDQVNTAISDQDFLKAYGLVDSYYSQNTTFNKELATTLNKKVVMAEVGSILEQDLKTEVKATKIIMLVKERNMFDSEGDLLNDIIEIANSLGDDKLASRLIKARKKQLK